MSFQSQIMQDMPRGAYSSRGGQGNPASVYSMKENIPSGYRKSSVSQYTPEQMKLFSQYPELFGEGSQLRKMAMGDQGQFDEIEAPALRQFNELQGGLSSRFSGMGGLGAQKSSGFKNASNAAAQDFASQLQSNRQGLQRQALQDLMGYSESFLNQRPYEQGLAQKRQKPPGFWHEAGVGFFSGLGKGAGEAGGAALFA